MACKAIKKSKVERARGGSILKAKRNIGRVNFEVEAMNRLRHEGVCRLYEVVQSSYVYCFIEAGERDLFSFLDGHPRGCPEPAVVAFIARIAAPALRHCHQRGIAHRDVKPENVLVLGSPATWGKGCRTLSIIKLCAIWASVPIYKDGHVSSLSFVGSPGFFAPELFCEASYSSATSRTHWSGSVVLDPRQSRRTTGEVDDVGGRRRRHKDPPRRRARTPDPARRPRQARRVRTRP